MFSLSRGRKLTLALLVAAAAGGAIFAQQIGLSRCIIDLGVVLLLSGASTILLMGLYEHVPSADMFKPEPTARSKRVSEQGLVALIYALLAGALIMGLVHCLSRGAHLL